MKVKFFCARWGYEQTPWPLFLQQVKAAGYAGIEWFPYGEDGGSEEVLLLLQQLELEYCIVMTVTGNNGNGYMQRLETQLLELAGLGGEGCRPRFISAQTGREYFTAGQVLECLDICEKVEKQTGIPVYQETHRNKWSYAAHVVKPFLQQLPQLRLTLDVSHWFCVSESFLEDQQEAVELAIRQARHVHARVGHTQGPQVKDPALPQYAAALQAHLDIWDRWIAGRKAAGASCCTMTPEFGPPPYLVNCCGATPQEEQWRLNLWMKNLLEHRYNQ